MSARDKLAEIINEYMEVDIPESVPDKHIPTGADYGLADEIIEAGWRPPLLKAWDEIDGKEAGHLPDGSIFAQERGIPFQAISKFRVGNGRNEWTRQAFQEIWKDASFTVLRVGWGRSAE